MTFAADYDDPRYGPWNPGIESQIPTELMHLATIFRPETARNTLADVQELHDLTGLPLPEISAFRPERLALHEVLVRVTANISVPDGNRIEDLGISFRQITRTLLERHVEPQMATIRSVYDATRGALGDVVERELERIFPVPGARTSTPAGRGWWQRAFGGGRGVPQPAVVSTAALVAEWEAAARAAGDPVERAAARALARTVSALLVKHGEVWGERSTIARVAVDLAANTLGSDVIGALIEPMIAAAAAQEGFPLLPRQDHPVVMNTKGPSAAGKSTMRLLQKDLAGRIGVDWSEFALISPDIWRKQLLDYASLGPAYKYAGAFTGEELYIVDQKLDRYMARKAQRGGMSHLLIDRFRFDSFAPDSDEAGSNLLTRFGQIVYMFFLITPPHLLVDRAWNRGRDVGRYKAVDDTLAHAVEAYSGMPELFFTWVRRSDKRVHFEFLDNTVARGEPPRTAAFGWNDRLNILDVRCLIDIERFRKIDVNAQSPDALYERGESFAAASNCTFLRRCVNEFREVQFVEQASGRVYLGVEAGKLVFSDAELLRQMLADEDTGAGLLSALPELAHRSTGQSPFPRRFDASERVHTVGIWGQA
ncbi:MAG: hypothetical protein ABI593_16965 [Betaproteobacteria bacterium]